MDETSKSDLCENDPPPAAEGFPLVPHPGEAVDIPSIDGKEIVCEYDEYADLVREMKRAGIIRSHRRGVLCCAREVKDSFTGKDFVDWAVDKKLISRERAIFMGRQLVSRRFGVSMDEDQEFRDDPNALYKLSTSDRLVALNAKKLAESVRRPACEVAEDLRRVLLKLFSEFVTPDGKGVDYRGVKDSKYFDAYKKLTVELQRVDLDKMSREEKLAFFINVYNALVIHAIVERGAPPDNVWQRYKFFSTTAYNLGGHVYSLNDICNGVLRGNHGSPATLHLPPFWGGDPRTKMALDKAEPRVHFALNCGAKSGPPIKTYSPDEVDEQLDWATESFLEGTDAVRIDSEAHAVHMSQLFSWYKADFGRDRGERLKWVHEHMGGNVDKKRQLAEVLQGPDQCAVKYLPYNWGHNQKKWRATELQSAAPKEG